MKSRRSPGFTLVELLTVIAIIGILGAIVATALPRALEKAKLGRTQGAFQQVRTAAMTYATGQLGYPPAYGFIKFGARQLNPASSTPDNVYFLTPYTVRLGIHGTLDVYDEWTENLQGYDTNGDKALSLLEFSPIGQKNAATNQYDFSEALTALYDGSNVNGEVQRQLDAGERPFIYVPVNLGQFQKARRYWIENQQWYAGTWDPNAPQLRGMSFPPSKYDSFVLISVGPSGSTFGVIPSNVLSSNRPNLPTDAYHIAALRAYFLATRDLNDNNLSDFDFTSRTQQQEGDIEPGGYTVNVNGQQVALTYPNSATPIGPNWLPPPDGVIPAENSAADEAWNQYRNNAGPLIFVVK